jgi:gamma-carbonic anhydrase
MDTETRFRTFAATPPFVAGNAYLAKGAVLIGDVQIGEFSSVWYQCTLRADIAAIRIGRESNIQDAAVVHVADNLPVMVGDRVTVGHSAILHACAVEDEVLVGMGSVILDGARIGARSIVGANATVTGGTIIPPGSLVLGSPARVVRPLRVEEQERLGGWALKYVELSRFYCSGGAAVRIG